MQNNQKRLPYISSYKVDSKIFCTNSMLKKREILRKLFYNF